jgi:DNA-binding IclR family transcriptional regulator
MSKLAISEAQRRAASAETEEAGSPQGLLERTLSVLELLARNAQGMQLSDIADTLHIPRSATHRVLTSLAELGYVRQERQHGDYLLTAKIVSLGFMFLAGSGVTDLAQPILDRLARDTQELARLGMLEGERLTFIAKAQGSPHGLRYDPDMGQPVRLSCSSSGLAWLACLSDEEALRIVEGQGWGSREEFGPKAPENAAAFLKMLRATRKRGYALTVQTYSPWMAAMAAVVRRADTGEVAGAVTIAGPHIRLTEEKMEGFAPLLLEAAKDLSMVLVASPAVGGRRATVFGVTP